MEMAISSCSSTITLPNARAFGKRTSSVSAALRFSSSNSSFVTYSFKPLSLVQSNRSNLLNRKKNRFSCNCLFGLGVPELVVIAGVAALVFGPKKLPEVGRSIGKTVKSFQQAAKEFETELKKEPDLVGDALEKTANDTTGEQEKEDAKVPSAKESL